LPSRIRDRNSGEGEIVKKETIYRIGIGYDGKMITMRRIAPLFSKDEAMIRIGIEKGGTDTQIAYISDFESRQIIEALTEIERERE
jgi:hypothetical protein